MPIRRCSTLVRALQSAGQLHEFALAPLDAAEVANLAGRVGKRELEIAETMHLFRETEGVPLFVVEMVRAGLGPEARQPVQWREFTPLPNARTHRPHCHPSSTPSLPAGWTSYQARRAN